MGNQPALSQERGEETTVLTPTEASKGFLAGWHKNIIAGIALLNTFSGGTEALVCLINLLHGRFAEAILNGFVAGSLLASAALSTTVLVVNSYLESRQGEKS